MSAISEVGYVADARELDDVPMASELAKLGAFMRRDFLIAWSYRMAFVSDAGSLLFQAVTFWFVGKLINPDVLPKYGGTHAGYMEFVAIGILLSAFIELGLSRIAQTIRQEQLFGTLESLLLTPTGIGTIQAGSVLYPMIYIPIRTVLFLALIAVGFGVHFDAAGILPSLLLLLVFLPFVWGLGVVAAASMLTFRQGGLGLGFLSSVLVLGSGAFFPLTLLPHWVQTLSAYNPIARTIDGLRAELIGGSSAGLPKTILIVSIASSVAFVAGLAAFKKALDRERRRGTLGAY